MSKCSLVLSRRRFGARLNVLYQFFQPSLSPLVSLVRCPLSPPIFGIQSTLRFADAETLSSVLAVTKGAVSPLAVVNDKECVATLAVDMALLNTSEKILVHPLRNDRTVSIKAADLVKVRVRET